MEHCDDNNKAFAPEHADTNGEAVEESLATPECPEGTDTEVQKDDDVF